VACYLEVKPESGFIWKPSKQKLGVVTMNRIIVHAVVFLALVGLLSACSKTVPRSRIAGIVQSHVNAYRSGTGTSADLVRGNQIAGGFHYGDAKKADWKSEVHWAFTGHRGENDVYQFKWVFSPVGGQPVSSEREVEYDGKKPVILFQNESETISIEPGSVPLTQNSQQAPGHVRQ
jgi:hypothetical protein